MVPRAFCDIGVSAGNSKLLSQLMILLYVSMGFSHENGGEPYSISYRITPRDHQSHRESYPLLEKTSGAM